MCDVAKASRANKVTVFIACGLCEEDEIPEDEFLAHIESHTQQALSQSQDMDVFAGDMEKLTLENDDYRRVIHTTKEEQLVVMKLPPNGEIEKESHTESSQFIRIEEGTCTVHIGENQVAYDLVAGGDDFIMIPSNTIHHVQAGENGAKLYTLYAPPVHH